MDGKAEAEIEFSSPNYDYVRIGEETYFPVNDKGNSRFLLPVLFFDRELTIHADTTAMSKPHEIEYTVTFLSETIREAQ